MSLFDQLLATANQALGTKYVWGGNSLTGGVDCSGFVKQAYAAIGIELPRVSNLQARAGTTIAADQAQPGDLVWWDLNGRNQGADHIGIYLGNGMVMEASSSQGKVVVRKLWGQANFTRPNGVNPNGLTAEGDGPAQPVPMGTQNLLAELIDPEDQGETGATVGAYNFARMTLERMQALQRPTTDPDKGALPPPPEPSLPAPAEDYALPQTKQRPGPTPTRAFRMDRGL